MIRASTDAHGAAALPPPPPVTRALANVIQREAAGIIPPLSLCLPPHSLPAGRVKIIWGAQPCCALHAITITVSVFIRGAVAGSAVVGVPPPPLPSWTLEPAVIVRLARMDRTARAEELRPLLERLAEGAATVVREILALGGK